MKINIISLLFLLSAVPFIAYIYLNVGNINITFIQKDQDLNQFIEYKFDRIKQTSKEGETFYILDQTVPKDVVSETAQQSIGKNGFISNCEYIVVRVNIKANSLLSESLVSVDCSR